MARCGLCGRRGREISGVIGFCASCVKGHFEEVWPQIEKVHHESRRRFSLPAYPPRHPNGAKCKICIHECSIPEGEKGYCGLRKTVSGTIKGGRPHEGSLSWYHDPLPTNCVADWVCPGGTGCGYPRYSKKRGPEIGYLNLAVFYHACSFNCLYCQNHHFKELTGRGGPLSSKELAQAVNERTTCICFFGGDPTPQVLHAIKASKLAMRIRGEDILRICWETNGAVREPFLTQMAKLSMASGGCIKVDLKAWDQRVHMALCGVSNRQTLETIRKLAKLFSERPEPPFLVVSTLLVPGYVDEEEVAAIASFLRDLDPRIPYALLAFYPCFWLQDLPTTSREHAERCLSVAKSAGLERVRVGNVHLLGPPYRGLDTD